MTSLQPVLRLVGVTFLAMVLLAVPADAHTDVATSEPAKDEVLTSPLDQVVLIFEDALMEGGDHAIAVFAPDGETRVDDDTTTTPSPESIAVGMTLTEPGVHEVRWIIIAADGDEQRGDYTFEVADQALLAPEPTNDPPTAPPMDDASSEPAPAATSDPDPDPTEAEPAADEADGNGGGATPAILAILIAFGVAAAVIAVAASRRRS